MLDLRRMLNLRLGLWMKLTERMLAVDVDVLIGLMVDDFASDVDQWDAVCLCDVEDGIAGAVGEPPHADVKTMVAALSVINGELGEQVCHV
jgi:hypothetical protein